MLFVMFVVRVMWCAGSACCFVGVVVADVVFCICRCFRCHNLCMICVVALRFVADLVLLLPLFH